MAVSGSYRGGVADRPFDRDGKAGFRFIVDLKGKRFFKIVGGPFVGKFQLTGGIGAGRNRFRQFNLKELIIAGNHCQLNRLIRDIKNAEFHFIAHLFGKLRQIEFIRSHNRRVSGIGTGDDGSDNLNPFIGRTFVRFNFGAFGYAARIFFGAENNFYISAVTDSNLRFFQRSFGAASTRHHFQNLQAIGTFRLKPEFVRDFGVLRNKTKIKS